MRIYSVFLIFLTFACSQATDPQPKDKDIELSSNQAEVPENDTISTTSLIEEQATDEATSEAGTSTEYEDIDWDEYEQSLTKDFSFVILISTKSYESALKRAKDASNKLGYPLDLRGLHPNDEMGLSLPEEVCEAICGGDVVDYPQYLPRNDWGETKYVSVEYSNGFQGFTKGYYIVIVASGEKGDPIIQEALKESRQFYKDAYAKTCGVWMGCGC